MSIYRMIARMAAVCALNNYMQEPWPTLAKGFIFDSKIEPIEDMKFDRTFPCVVIYTDYDKDHWPRSGRIHDPRMMSFTFEFLVVQNKDDGNGGFTLECPMTDSEIETVIDILENQTLMALKAGNEASDAFNYICPSIHQTISRRGSTVEGGMRLAARQLTIEMDAIRPPLMGGAPPIINAFLSRLETFPDYADRVDAIRAALTPFDSQTEAEARMRVMGYARSVADMLGQPQGPQPVLATPIVFHGPIV